MEVMPAKKAPPRKHKRKAKCLNWQADDGAGCKAAPDGSRGLCWRCYRQLLSLVRTGQLTWEEAEGLGLAQKQKEGRPPTSLDRFPGLTSRRRKRRIGK